MGEWNRLPQYMQWIYKLVGRTRFYREFYFYFIPSILCTAYQHHMECMATGEAKKKWNAPINQIMFAHCLCVYNRVESFTMEHLPLITLHWFCALLYSTYFLPHSHFDYYCFKLASCLHRIYLLHFNQFRSLCTITHSITITNPYYLYRKCRHILVAGIVQFQINVDHLAGRVSWHGNRCKYKQWIACTAKKQTIRIEALRFFFDNRMLQFRVAM